MIALSRSTVAFSLAESTIDALVAGAIVAAVLFLPIAVLASPVGRVFHRSDEHRPSDGGSAVLLWPLLAVVLLALVVPPVAFLERFGLLLPLVAVLPLVSHVWIHFVAGSPMGIVLVSCSLPVYGLSAALEHALRWAIADAVAVSLAWPSPPPLLVGNWTLITVLGVVPLLVFLVDQWRRTLGYGEWTVDGYDDERAVPAWVPVVPLSISLLLVVAMAVVPVALFATLEALTPLFLLCIGAIPFATALDGRGLRRHRLDYSLVVPAAVVCAIIEYDLRSVWLG